MQQRTTSRVASTITTSRAGTMSAAAFCTTTSRPASGKKWMRLQRHYSRSWMSPEGPGGLKPWSQSTLHTSSKYGYADDLAIMLQRPTWKAMEEGLNRDMGTLVAYLRKWRLQLSRGKTVLAAYHLNNREAKRELDVFVDNKHLEF